MNQSKSAPFIIGGVVIVLALIVVYAQYTKKSNAATYQPETSIVATGTEVTTATESVTTYTAADIALHANKASCWTSINGSVYDVTKWISQHPGGARAIMSLCGHDGSQAFNGQHGGQARPANELAGFKIGTLAK